jgi:hypothetical protein
MAESMPQMLREEAFHLATGVVPWRRMVEDAARGEVWVSMATLQKHLNKWLPRGLEMFGHEKGGDTNVKYGLKPMKNAEAQDAYYQEVAKMIRDLNLRFVRARNPGLDHAAAAAVLERLLAGEVVEGVARPEELLRMPAKEFFRRRGEPAFRLVGVDGEAFGDVEEYVRHLAQHLPEQYLAGRDFEGFVSTLRKLAAGEMTAKEAAAATPNLRRVGGVCPCSRSVRWVQDAPVAASGNGGGNGHAAVAAEAKGVAGG